MQKFFVSVVVVIGIIVAALIVRNAYIYKFKQNETVTVTGLAEKNFSSDLIVWRGTFERKTMTLKEAYSLIKADENAIKKYLKENGVTDSEIIFSSIKTEKEFFNTYNANGTRLSSTFTGFKLSEDVTVESKEIDKVEKVSREVTQLIESGTEINSYEPSYYYTNLSELKIDLLAKASADAHKRAETIAENSGSSLGKIKSANMGVFQITGQNSNEGFSEGGTFNTSSKNKKASITMRINYALK
jgi:hypothetical protein